MNERLAAFLSDLTKLSVQHGMVVRGKEMVVEDWTGGHTVSVLWADGEAEDGTDYQKVPSNEALRRGGYYENGEGIEWMVESC